jgi:hypothetical protein
VFNIRVHREKPAGAIVIIALTGDGTGRINHKRTDPVVFIVEPLAAASLAIFMAGMVLKG